MFSTRKVDLTSGLTLYLEAILNHGSQLIKSFIKSYHLQESERACAAAAAQEAGGGKFEMRERACAAVREGAGEPAARDEGHEEEGVSRARRHRRR